MFCYELFIKSVKKLCFLSKNKQHSLSCYTWVLDIIEMFWKGYILDTSWHQADFGGPLLNNMVQ